MGAERTKKTIIEVASKLFEKYGFYKTTMDEVAKVANKAKGSLYYHFKSKEELFAAVIDVELTKVKMALASIVENTEMNSEEKLRAYFLTRMKVLNDHAHNYKEALKTGIYPKNVHVNKVRYKLEVWEKQNIKKIIQQGIDEGNFTDISRSLDVIMEVFVIVQKGLESPFVLDGHYMKFAVHFNDMINILIKGLRK
jgi:AcrR family transcriptional regulator